MKIICGYQKTAINLKNKSELKYTTEIAKKSTEIENNTEKTCTPPSNQERSSDCSPLVTKIY